MAGSISCSKESLLPLQDAKEEGEDLGSHCLVQGHASSDPASSAPRSLLKHHSGGQT